MTSPPRPEGSSDLHGLGAAGVFRDATAGVLARRAALAAARRQELADLPRRVLAVWAGRAGQVAGSVVALAGALVAAVLALLQVELAPVVLLGAVPAGWIARLVAGELAAIEYRRELAGAVSTSDDPAADVARLAAIGPALVLRRGAAHLAPLAAGLHLVAGALLRPLVCHALLFLALDLALDPDPLQLGRDFTPWMALAVIGVWQCHAYVAWRGWRLAQALARDEAEAPAGGEALQAVGMAALLALPAGTVISLWLSVTRGVPASGTLVRLLGPPVIVAITGLLCIPQLFRATARRFAAEEAALAALARRPPPGADGDGSP